MKQCIFMIKLDLENDSLPITEFASVNHRSRESLRLAGGPHSNTPAHHGPTSTSDQVAQGCSQLSFECLQGQRLHHLPGPLCQCLTTLTVRTFFLSNQNVICCKLLMALCPSMSSSKESPALFSVISH